jgi:hypothetical protein
VGPHCSFCGTFTGPFSQVEGCGRWFLGPWDLEGHTAAEHPGLDGTYELLRPYPNQRQRVVYRRSGPPAS